ncbi:hypothetical protein [Bosea sp. FBZP-16]|uniref:hypothetical protein n=1 Tax=Bosea sp. FBZP-16 TaxID=2065382 RepID=UPI000C300353|nr:hypothetical protein [Bosea sp. FBZP-16]
MADFSPAFAHANGDKRMPTAGEIEDGLGCGPLSLPLFNGLFNALYAELGGLITLSAITPSNANMQQVAEAVQSGRICYAVATGTANAWVVTPVLAVPAYSAGRVLWIKAPATNTNTSVTANVSTLGARPLKKADGSNPAIGDIQNGRWYPTIDDGTNICIISMLPSDARAAMVGLTGNCVLWLDGTALRLSRKNGSQLIVNGQPVEVPLVGPALSTAGNSNSVDYFIYAYVDGSGALQLEKSTTSYVIGSDGTPIKNGDPSRAHVGIAGSNASGAWEDSFSNRLVRSYFNRESKRGFNRFTADRSTAAGSGSPAEINTEIRCNFVCYPDDLVDGFATGYCFNSGASGTTYSVVTYDGTVTNNSGISAVFGTSGGPVAAHQQTSGLTVGRHYATLTGYNSSGTGTWGGNSASAPSCLVHVSLR